MPKVDERKIKRLIEKLQSRSHPTPQELSNPVRAKMRMQRRRTAKQIGSHFAKAGIDVKGIDRILAADQAERRKTLAKQTPQEKRLFSRLGKTVRRELSSVGRVAEELGTHTDISTIYLTTPYTIVAKHPLRISGDLVLPWNSWVTVRANTDEIGGGARVSYLSFYFYWRNPNAYWAVANIGCRLILVGKCIAVGEPGLFFRGMAATKVKCSLHPIEAWRNPDRMVPTQLSASTYVPSASVHAEGGAFSDNQTYNIVYDVIELRHRLFAIPANETALFEVRVSIETVTDSDDALAVADFSTRPGILCPFVSLELDPDPPRD
jgi:hypothetical protein